MLRSLAGALALATTLLALPAWAGEQPIKDVRHDAKVEQKALKAGQPPPRRGGYGRLRRDMRQAKASQKSLCAGAVSKKDGCLRR